MARLCRSAAMVFKFFPFTLRRASIRAVEWSGDIYDTNSPTGHRPSEARLHAGRQPLMLQTAIVVQ